MKVEVIEKRRVTISTEFIKLEAAMKLAGLAMTGGAAKIAIQNGEVTVNGEECTQRGRKLRSGDVFQYGCVRCTVWQDDIV